MRPLAKGFGIFLYGHVCISSQRMLGEFHYRPKLRAASLTLSSTGSLRRVSVVDQEKRRPPRRDHDVSKVQTVSFIRRLTFQSQNNGSPANGTNWRPRTGSRSGWQRFGSSSDHHHHGDGGPIGHLRIGGYLSKQTPLTCRSGKAVVVT